MQMKLELTWINKDKKVKLEPRVLLEDESRNYYSKCQYSENDDYENSLIFADNLLALATEPEVEDKLN